MLIFDRKDLKEFSLPITDEKVIDLCKQTGTEMLLASAYADGFLVAEHTSIRFLARREKYPDHWFDENWIGGAFFLDGQILQKKEDLLVGIFSYQLHKHGFVWVSELKNQSKCIPI